jgi:hypothetical protein
LAARTTQGAGQTASPASLQQDNPDDEKGEDE